MKKVKKPSEIAAVCLTTVMTVIMLFTLIPVVSLSYDAETSVLVYDATDDMQAYADPGNLPGCKYPADQGRVGNSGSGRLVNAGSPDFALRADGGGVIVSNRVNGYDSLDVTLGDLEIGLYTLEVAFSSDSEMTFSIEYADAPWGALVSGNGKSVTLTFDFTLDEKGVWNASQGTQNRFRLNASPMEDYCIESVKIYLNEGEVIPAGERPKYEWGNTGMTGKDIGNGNPLFTQRFGADPGWVEYEDRLYVYLTNDTPIYNNDGFIIDNNFANIKHINVISSADLINWTDHGSIPVAGPGHVATFASNSWAPSVAHKKIDGEDYFFLYFANSGGGVGVLRSKSPVGPWEDPRKGPLVSHSTPNCSPDLVPWCFDPAVFIDDDGTAYLYFGGGVPEGRAADPGSARVVKLGDDMVSIDGVPQEIYVPYFFEALDMVKRDGVYYLSYCSNWQGQASATTPGQAQIIYMKGDNPMGPFEYGGLVLKNPGALFGKLTNNNHHSITYFKDNWYLLYHATLVADAKGVRDADGKQVNYRSPHINELNFLPDGSIEEVAGDRKGVAQLTTLDPYTRVEAETIAWSSSISTMMEDPTQETSINLFVNDLKNEDWIAVAGVDFGGGENGGAKSFHAGVYSNGKAGGTITLRLDTLDGPVIGTVDISAGVGGGGDGGGAAGGGDGGDASGDGGGAAGGGGDASTAGRWKTYSADITETTGVHDLYMVFSGVDDAALFDFDWWQLSTQAADAGISQDAAQEGSQQGSSPDDKTDSGNDKETSDTNPWVLVGGSLALLGILTMLAGMYFKRKKG